MSNEYVRCTYLSSGIQGECLRRRWRRAATERRKRRKTARPLCTKSTIVALFFLPTTMANNKLPKKRTILGQDPDILLAALANIISWLVATFAPSLLPYLLPTSPDEEPYDGSTAASQTKCISIGRPGGMEQLRLVALRPGVCTIGYNVRHVSPPPYTHPNVTLPSDCVIIKNEAFSVNYADCTIRVRTVYIIRRIIQCPLLTSNTFVWTL
jgi:hypothetical protein